MGSTGQTTMLIHWRSSEKTSLHIAVTVKVIALSDLCQGQVNRLSSIKDLN